MAERANSLSAVQESQSDQPMGHARPTVLFLCTGNAARSVMGAAFLRDRCETVDVVSAGTHSIPGLPMSTRTRTALAEFGSADPDHRSAQFDAAMVDADLIAYFEPMHLIWLRRNFPDVVSRSGSLRRLARDLAPGPAETLADRIATLGLDSVTFEEWEEVIDPAGGDVADFVEAAGQISAMVDQLLPALGVAG